MIGCRLFTEALDICLGCLRFKQRVVDQTGPVTGGAGFAEYETYSRCAGIDDSIHSLGTAIKAFAGAPAHGGLTVATAIQSCHNDVGYLLYKSFQITVIRDGHQPLYS
jgi:hypothetical protein